MSYKLTNTLTGESILLLHREWEILLVLTERYGWSPERGDIDHYAEGGTVSNVDAAGMAAAIERALPDIPGFYADGLTEAERPKPTTTDDLRARPGDAQEDPLAYFSGHQRLTLRNFVNWMGTGAFEVRLSPGFSPEY